MYVSSYISVISSSTVTFFFPWWDFIFFVFPLFSLFLLFLARACLYAGVNISGYNAEAMPAQVCLQITKNVVTMVMRKYATGVTVTFNGRFKEMRLHH